MNDGKFNEVNGFFYMAEADEVDGVIKGTVEFMRKSNSGGTFVPGVIYTLSGPFQSLDQALAAASKEGYDRAISGGVNFD